MATTTTNYGFKKPDVTDLISPSPYNDNFDVLDTNLKTINTNIQTINTALNGLKFSVLTQTAYNALTTKDSNTIYFITE